MLLGVPTVVTVAGFNVRINSYDHLPPHVHVVRAGCEARFAVQRGRVEVMSNVGFSGKELADAMQVVVDNYGAISRTLGTMSWTKPRANPKSKRKK